jgi:hypothetical protein
MPCNTNHNGVCKQKLCCYELSLKLISFSFENLGHKEHFTSPFENLILSQNVF